MDGLFLRHVISRYFYGKTVCIHADFRDLGPNLEKWSSQLVESFLTEDCTIMTPVTSAGLTDPLAESLLKLSKRLVSHDNCFSFCAAGPQAARLIQPDQESHYSPLQKLIEENGKILLIDSVPEKISLVHYAEALCGRHLPSQTTKGAIECQTHFNRLNSVLETCETRFWVGKSLWRTYDAAALMPRLLTYIQANPDFGPCNRAHCAPCQTRRVYKVSPECKPFS